MITNGKTNGEENGSASSPTETATPTLTPTSTPTPEEEVTLREDTVWQDAEPVPPHSFPKISGLPLVETLENGIRFVTLLIRDHTGL